MYNSPMSIPPPPPPKSIDHAAAAYTAAAAITATAGGLSFQTYLNCNYIGPDILWQDTFLQNAFAALSDYDMASSQEDLEALQTLATDA